MSYLVFDIETIGKQYDELDETTKSYFRQWAERDASSDDQVEKELENIKRGLPFSPFLGEIVAIGMIDEQDKGAVYFRIDGSNPPLTKGRSGGVLDFEDGGIQYRVGSEKEILEKFWEVSRNYYTFVTFNGRAFDAPFLMIRSAAHGIRPSRNLMPNRYLSSQKFGTQHVDLSDQLTFYGAVRRLPKLHFVTKAFHIESPKEGGMSGEEVPKAFHDGRYEEIARYCMDDVVATKKLFESWNKYLNYESNSYE
ncbi:MAG: ribonuclease H-like domain-containing protein [Candidatus Spechtbacteria bacterium]|nr:ribonuclease H-like domain-containing protein [Candidatus Spechtbacteria bacterium]